MASISHFWELILGTILALLPMLNPPAAAPAASETEVDPFA